MAKPRWDTAGSNIALADIGYSTIIGSPQARSIYSSLPSVDGVAVGEMGVGPRTITGSGWMEGAAAATAAGAVLNAKTALRVTQAKVDSETKTFTDSDAHDYTYCRLQSYEQVTPFVARKEGATGFIARCRVTWRILQQEATF